jgi:hypothetical protein
MRAIGLTALVAASVVGLAVFATPASSQRNVINHSFSLDEAALVKEAGNRRGRIHATRPLRMGPLQRVPSTIVPITGTPAPILIAILESNLALTNVLATTATGSVASERAGLVTIKIVCLGAY